MSVHGANIKQAWGSSFKGNRRKRAETIESHLRKCKKEKEFRAKYPPLYINKIRAIPHSGEPVKGGE